MASILLLCEPVPPGDVWVSAATVRALCSALQSCALSTHCPRLPGGPWSSRPHLICVIPDRADDASWRRASWAFFRTGSLHPLLPTIPLTIPYDDIPSAGGLGKGLLCMMLILLSFVRFRTPRIKLTSIHPRQTSPSHSEIIPTVWSFALSPYSCLRVVAASIANCLPKRHNTHVAQALFPSP